MTTTYKGYRLTVLKWTRGAQVLYVAYNGNYAIAKGANRQEALILAKKAVDLMEGKEPCKNPKQR